MGLQLIVSGFRTALRRTGRRARACERLASRTTVTWVLSTLAAGLAGCAGPGSPISEASRLRALQQQPLAPVAGDFPPPSSAVWPQGAPADVGRLAQMRRGLGKDEVRELLGVPHFRAGLAGVREWNYLLNFREGSGSAERRCQYMVRFNRDLLVSGLFWRDPDCALLASPPAAWPLDTGSDGRVRTRRIVLSSDGLFAPGEAGAELLPDGRSRLASFAAEVRRVFRTPTQVIVTAHTDRLARAAESGHSTLAHAEAVRRALIEQGGFEPTTVRAFGMGGREPVSTNCVGSARETIGVGRHDDLGRGSKDPSNLR
ncbi:MAG: outer membrane protein assembly factor BamE, partial [Comamonadaceae bacterium]